MNDLVLAWWAIGEVAITCIFFVIVIGVDVIPKNLWNTIPFLCASCFDRSPILFRLASFPWCAILLVALAFHPLMF